VRADSALAIGRSVKADSVSRAIQEHGTRTLVLQTVDMQGVVRETRAVVADLSAALQHGVWVDGWSTDGAEPAGERERLLVPDLDTLALGMDIVSGKPTANLICDEFTAEHRRCAYAPRSVLVHVLERAAEMGLLYRVRTYIEFHCLREHPAGKGEIEALAPSRDVLAVFWAHLDAALEASHIAVESTTAPDRAGGRAHIALFLGCAHALRAADDIARLRRAVVEAAMRSGLCATFMPKLAADWPGARMAFGQSLADIHAGADVTTDLQDRIGTTPKGKSFAAGQLRHATGLQAILCPLVTSYTRMIAHGAVPLTASWGTGRHMGELLSARRHRESSRTMIEVQGIDPSANPYLSLSALLAAGLDGISKGLELSDSDALVPSPRHNVRATKHRNRSRDALNRAVDLPLSLGEALNSLEADLVVREALGEPVIGEFLRTKRHEWDDWVRYVSPWEWERSLVAQ